MVSSPANYLEISVNDPVTHGEGRTRFTDFRMEMAGQIQIQVRQQKVLKDFANTNTKTNTKVGAATKTNKMMIENACKWQILSLLTHLFAYPGTITDYFWAKYADYWLRLHTSIANSTIFPGFLFHLDEIFRLQMKKKHINCYLESC